MSPLFLKGTTVIVTGAGSGIGRAAAEAFAREGAQVVVSDISFATASDTVERITDRGGVGFAHAADVSQEDDLRCLIDATLGRYGRLDCAFNNAGINIELDQSYNVANVDRTMEINCRGVFLAMKYEIAAMLKQGHGSIVNTASVMGLVGIPRSPGYVASKHAVVGAAKQAALQFGPQGIRVNAICPGIIDTPMVNDRPGSSAEALDDFARASTALQRLGRPEEIAEAVIWLSSTRASYVTGLSMIVDGGFTAS